MICVDINECEKKETPVVNEIALSPHELVKQLGDLLELPQQPNPAQLMPLIKQTLEMSVRTWSPRFMDKLYAGTRPISAIAEMIIGVLNTNHVYHVSPVFTLMEKNLIFKLGSLMGYHGGHGGILMPGGSYSNLHAIVTARNYLFPGFTRRPDEDQQRKSPYPFSHNLGPLQAFTTNRAHYSVTNSCLTIGLTHDNIIRVETDAFGRMKPDCLRNAIEKSVRNGNRPFFLHMTAGTTVLGAFDPIKECAAIAHEYGLWAHLDGSWGGSIAFASDTNLKEKLIGGASTCDSITWNPHKLMGVPLLCSAFLVKKASIVAVNSLKAGYLFHEDESFPDIHNAVPASDDMPGYKPWDLGDGTIGCGRRGDSLKLYLTWVLEGSKSFTDRVDHSLTLARKLYHLVTANESFMAVMDPEFVNVCFWFVPLLDTWEAGRNFARTRPELKTPLDVAQCMKVADYDLFFREMDKITKLVHSEVTRRGRFMVDYAPLVNEGVRYPVFWRIVLINKALTESDVHALFTEIENVGNSMKF